MSDRHVDRFAVRPKFLAWLTLAIALPVLAHAAWDYTEARRLRARVDAICSERRADVDRSGQGVSQSHRPRARSGTPVSRGRGARIRLE